MKAIKSLRSDLIGRDFIWQLIAGKSIPFEKENVFNDVSVLISSQKSLSCIFCNRATKAVNFKNNEKMINSLWDSTVSIDENVIKLTFEPAHPHKDLKILAVGAQYAVDSNINGFQFTARLKVTDTNGKTNVFENNQGKTLNKIIRKSNDPDVAVFLGAEADAIGEAIASAEFTVIPLTDPDILGFYINSLRLRIS
jgi:hypothetical protein